MVDQVDHAPLHNWKDDGSSVFEPNSSDGDTSFSLEIPELEDGPEGVRSNVIWEEESISAIGDSNNIFGFNDIVKDSDEKNDKCFKKRKME